ncbi:hypothetical protein, partial [Bordetella pertussis]|uniref:hypothetical protein n=1 Tax=Bordetella pertussis TaxID=520 RepID=UPI0013E8AEC9
HRARCTHLQTQPGRIQPIDSSQLAGAIRSRCCWRWALPCWRWAFSPPPAARCIFRWPTWRA